jgi:hypothetical protein
MGVITSFLQGIGLLPKTPLLHICAGVQLFSVSDPNLQIYIGTNLPSPLGKDVAALTFVHHKPTGVTLIPPAPYWLVIPDKGVSLKLVDGEGKESRLYQDASEDGGSISCLTLGSNRLFFDEQEIQLFVPAKNLLRGGHAVHFLSDHPAAASFSQPCAPTQELALGPVPLPSLHDAETGPVSGAVQTAMPDDPTRSEGAPLPARSGDTERLVEGEAAPKTAWQGPGTEPIVVRRKTEPLIEAVPAVSRAPQKLDFRIEPSLWGLGDKLDFLRSFRGPKGRGLIKPEVLESAIRILEGSTPPAGTDLAEATAVVAYLRLIRMGIASPFDLEREISLLRQRPESRERIFAMELRELRALLDVEPLETNRAVLLFVLEKAELDIVWLHDPMNRVLHLLCRKRAGSLRPDILRKYPFDILAHWKLFCSADSPRKVLF